MAYDDTRQSAQRESTAQYNDAERYRRQAAQREGYGRNRGQAAQREDSERSADRSRYAQQAQSRRTSSSRYSDQAQSRRAEQSRHSGQAQPRRASESRYAGQAQSANARRTQQGRSGSAQQGRSGAAQYNDPARYTAAGGYNSLYDKRNNATVEKSKAPMIVGIAVAVVAVIAAIWFFLVPKPFDVTVNGKEVTMNPGATVADLVDEGFARPVPGNLIAVDGSLITTGEGERFTATIDGKPASADAKLSRDMTVEIANGGDITEEFTSEETVIPFDTVNDDMSFSAYWDASIHLLSDGEDGLAITKTGKISGKTVQEVTKPAVAGGYHIYTAQPTDKVIALTFDDGPWPETTDEILDILEANGAKATFFTIGNQISSYSDSVVRANNMGCEVCTHSWDHADGSGQGVDLTLMSAEEQVSEVLEGYAAIASVIGKEPTHIMRAPGGNFHDDIIYTLWPYVDAEIGWDVDTEDWSLPGVEAIVSRILSVEPGQVILMHDGGGDRAQTVEALRQALPVLVERGYKFVTVSELLAYGMPADEQAAQADEQPADEGYEEDWYGEEYYGEDDGEE